MGVRGLIILAFLALALGGQPQRKSTPPVGTNLINCVKGLSGCDISALSPDEIKQVSEASKKRNLDSCLEGSTLCDPTRLSSADATAVQASRYRRNLDKCLNGSATCNPIMLNNKDAAAVKTAAARRNFEKCLSGSPSCDPADEAATGKRRGFCVSPQLRSVPRRIARL
jgi:hypothetical protein